MCTQVQTDRQCPFWRPFLFRSSEPPPPPPKKTKQKQNKNNKNKKTTYSTVDKSLIEVISRYNEEFPHVQSDMAAILAAILVIGHDLYSNLCESFIEVIPF